MTKVFLVLVFPFLLASCGALNPEVESGATTAGRTPTYSACSQTVTTQGVQQTPIAPTDPKTGSGGC